MRGMSETVSFGYEDVSPEEKTQRVGAVFTHREFKQPLDARLTDEAWRAQLAAEARQGGGHVR